MTRHQEAAECIYKDLVGEGEDPTDTLEDTEGRALAWVMYMRFARRSVGVKHSRDVFGRARRWEECPWQVWAGSAMMEWERSHEEKVRSGCGWRHKSHRSISLKIFIITSVISRWKLIMKIPQNLTTTTAHHYNHHRFASSCNPRLEQVARNIFEAGLKKQMSQPKYIEAYADFMAGMGDAANVRTLYERAIQVRN